MASTSTNKQPLLIDRPLLSIKDTSGLLVGTLPPGVAIDPQAAAGVMLVDCTKNDGAIVEHIWTMAREQNVMSYEYDPNKVAPNPPPPEATHIGPVTVEGGGSSNVKSFTAIIGDVDPKQVAASDISYKWTVSGEGEIEGANDQSSVTVKVTKGLTTVTVKVTSAEEVCVNSPQFAAAEVDFAGLQGGVVQDIDDSDLPTTGKTYTAVTDNKTRTNNDGQGCTLNTTVDGDGNIVSVEIESGGTGYLEGDRLTLKGGDMGGTDGDDDVTFEVTAASQIQNQRSAHTVIRQVAPMEENGEWYDPNPLLLLGYIVNFYICPSNTVFIPEKAFFVGGVVADTREGGKTQLFNHPEVLAPVTGVGSVEEEGGEVKPTYGRALYIPKGQALWAAAVQLYLPNGDTDTAAFSPLACVQGGYY